LSLAGRIDETGAAKLKDQLLAVDAGNVNKVVLDFRAVTFVGSAGIGKLIVLYNQVSARNIGIQLINMPAGIFTLFQSMKLDQLFSMSRV
jgi:anti-anti-sigma factor